ncbi:hypothetical protein [Yersinia alsatica]|uniref:hypothetical protein n=1 Tax=Yersinia alsatica TaxID=2890317 RepID=UPI0011A444AC|nr:hypothetical protein [Yersinia alsatica]
MALNIASSPLGIGQFDVISIVMRQTTTSVTTGTLPRIETKRLYFSISNTNPGTYIIAGCVIIFRECVCGWMVYRNQQFLAMIINKPGN